VAGRSQELRDAVRTHLESIGVDHVEFGVTGGTHQEAVFAFEGRRLRYTFASTTGDRRTLQNTVRSLKRFLAAPPRGPAPARQTVPAGSGR